MQVHEWSEPSSKDASQELIIGVQERYRATVSRRKHRAVLGEADNFSQFLLWSNGSVKEHSVEKESYRLFVSVYKCV